MLDAFRHFLAELAGGHKDEGRFAAGDYRLAATALLIHAAGIDGEMSANERNRLIGALMLQFGLDEAGAQQLIAAATEAEHQAVDLYHFTSILNRTLDERGREQLIETMWQVAYADGRVSEFEDNLIWRAADLLHVSGEARIALRRRVATARPGGDGHD